MSLDLSLDVVATALGTLESMRVRVVLRNGGSTALRLPGTADPTDALEIRAYASPHDTSPSWQANPRLRHVMMVSERPDWTEAALEVLQPGALWEWDLDLASYQYPLPQGDHWVEAVYRYAPENVDLRSERAAVTVSASEAHDLFVTRDNCVLDGLQVLLKTESEDGFCWIGRLHNAGRPLASWYSMRLDAGATGAHVLAAYNAFYRDDVFDHFFDRWFVEVAPSEARSQRIAGTHGVRERRTTSLPGAPRHPRAAFWDGADGLFLLSSAQGGSLHCHRLVSGEADPVFVHGSSFHLGMPSAVAVDAEHIHVVMLDRELKYERLDHGGNVVLRRELPRSRFSPFACRYDVDRRRVLATFWDGPNGRIVRLVALDVETGECRELERSLPLRGQDLREISFDVDLGGRFHLLVGTSRHRLYYCRDETGPWLVSSGERQFLPYVHAPRRVFLGYYQTPRGWRFRLYAARGLGGHLQPPDPPSAPQPPGGRVSALLGMTNPDLPIDPTMHITEADFGKTAEDLPQWDDDTVRTSVRIVDTSDPDRGRGDPE
ncbi:MAG: hypothetical protein IT379_34805 [Deltaproteobacteria bacterium]|nr:hypothetical protein [Deltaproteobacteria bacterium]